MRRLFVVVLSAVASLSTASLVACGGSDDTSSADPDAGHVGHDASTEDSGGGHDAGSGGEDAGTDSAAPSTPVRCTDAQFDQAADGTIGGDYTATTPPDVTFPTGGAPAQYEPRCLKVKKGAVVTFKGKFVYHPLEGNGGDSPTPIPTQSTDVAGNALQVTMDREGTFGFQCTYHPTTMFGAIRVVP